MAKDCGVAEIVDGLLSNEGYSREQLAAKLGVSASAVGRWQSGLTCPRPSVEGKLRELAQSVGETRARYSVQRKIDLHLGAEKEVRAAVDSALHELREIFHRRSRLASRSESLDEVSKLLFSHVLCLANEGRGINNDLLQDPRGVSVALRDFVSNAARQYLPTSIASELRSEDFELRLLPQETELATDVVRCFNRLSRQPGIVGPNGIEVVDLLNEVFGKFLADSFVDEKQLGQYLTPTEVVRMMVQMAIEDLSQDELSILASATDCSQFGYVLDPSCGVASFLAEFTRTLHGYVPEATGAEDLWLRNMLGHVVVGVDKSERMLRYAVTNLAMFGLPAAHLQLANAISKRGRDGLEMSSFDGRVGLILTNPPFGAEFDKEDTSYYRIGSLRDDSRAKLSSECLFVERYLDWLRPGGQLLAIVPDSILTNQGVFAALRSQIGPAIEIRNIVSLPSNTFAASGTTTKTSILHFRKKAEKAVESHMAMVSSCADIGYSISTRGSHKVKSTLRPGDLPRILDMIRSGRPDGKMSRWIESLEQAPRWDAGFHLSVTESLAALIADQSSIGVRVRDVASLRTDRHDPRRGVGEFRYIEISDIEPNTATCRAKTILRADAPSRARKLVNTGDVLVSTVRPDRGMIGVVRDDLDGATCTTGFAVLRPHDIHPLILAALLRSKPATAQILKHNIGIAYPAIDEKCLLDVVLPISKERLLRASKAAEAVERLQLELDEKRAEFQKLVSDELPAWS